MQNDIRDILETADKSKSATESGTHMHALLAGVVIDSGNVVGDAILAKRISENPVLANMFSAASMTEVPIAGFIDNRFVSRRIDRMLVDDVRKQIWILDYKTDTDSSLRISEYRRQLHEYAVLVGQIYKNYQIRTCILWTHDWRLEYI